MTTNDDIEVVEPEIIEPESPRDINTLLSLDTYQGMTDEEIDILIEYKCEVAVSNKIAESIQSVEEDSRKAMDAILDRLIDNSLRSNTALADRMSDRQYHSLEPLTVNATTLELEVSESG